jgi:hypothetical protein
MLQLILSIFCHVGYVVCRHGLAANVLQLPEGGDFGALHCQPAQKFDRSTKLDLTTEPPLLGRCCYVLPLLSFFYKFNGSVVYFEKV